MVLHSLGEFGSRPKHAVQQPGLHPRPNHPHRPIQELKVLVRGLINVSRESLGTIMHAVHEFPFHHSQTSTTNSLQQTLSVCQCIIPPLCLAHLCVTAKVHARVPRSPLHSKTPSSDASTTSANQHTHTQLLFNSFPKAANSYTLFIK